MALPAFRTPVLVVGAGVAGCVLALELAHHDVPSMVVERASRPPRHPELNLVSGRGMELLRRLGVAGRVRAEGIPPGRHATVAWSRSIAGTPLLVAPVPSAEELRLRHASDDGAPVEPYALVNGAGLTSRLRDAVRDHPLIDLREGWTFTDLRLEPGGATATVLDGAARERRVIEAGHLAGCDGADSTVRRCLGVPLDEAPTPAHHCTVYFRCDRLTAPVPEPSTIFTGGMTLTRDAASGLWIGRVPLEAEDASVTDPAGLLRRRLGIGLDASQIAGVAQWQDALGIARGYRRGNAYLAGQSAHRFHPPSDTVDTCLGDAVDLGWKLAAAVRGWGGPGLLRSYERERRGHAVRERESLSRALESRRLIGRLAGRDGFGEALTEALRTAPPPYDLAGTAHGDEFASSPVVWQDDRPAGPAGPGRRLPGRAALHDRLGPQLTLVDLTGRAEGRSMVEAARVRQIPMTHLPLTGSAARDDWASRLLLVRPDHRIAWRGVDRPADWDLVLDVITGHRPQDHVNT